MMEVLATMKQPDTVSLTYDKANLVAKKTLGFLFKEKSLWDAI